MKGQIGEYGAFLIERGNGRMVQQQCCFNFLHTCGESCPCFKEPMLNIQDDGRTTYIVRICNNVVWFFDEFEDLRGNKGEE